MPAVHNPGTGASSAPRSLRKTGERGAKSLAARRIKEIRMDLGSGLGHLTYSTLVHPGDTWAEIWDSLNRYVPKVKERVSPNAPFGVSLRISAASAETLTADPNERAKLKAFLDERDMYLYTVNAFPYGAFK